MRNAVKGKIWKASVNKPEKHVGKLDNYSYDRNRFKKFIEALPPNPKESWRQMGHKYWLQIKLDYQQVLQGSYDGGCKILGD